MRWYTFLTHGLWLKISNTLLSDFSTLLKNCFFMYIIEKAEIPGVVHRIGAILAAKSLMIPSFPCMSLMGMNRIR
ncbi:MAG: hypothetical protein JRJ46_13295 [Deltaproteobacteria bacterium]|nr:hypothetical protein [Deltaproteobacteria bacterium]